MTDVLAAIERDAIGPALALLPSRMDSREARILLRAICLQESLGQMRAQLLANGKKGPARGLWQFERGNRFTKGGIWGVFLHPASRYWLSELCRKRGCEFDPQEIWTQIELDDVLAAGLARLMLFTNPAPLPSVGLQQAAWDYYKATWRPGKPHPDMWPANYVRALSLRQAEAA